MTVISEKTRRRAWHSHLYSHLHSRYLIYHHHTGGNTKHT